VTKQIPWMRVFVEGLVIVFSILMAFWGDAWWDRKRRDR
jgi:TRAP-type C4-dicarboxylate transport system permease small subunit